MAAKTEPVIAHELIQNQQLRPEGGKGRVGGREALYRAVQHNHGKEVGGDPTRKLHS